jgi:hypothetical protein
MLPKRPIPRWAQIANARAAADLDEESFRRAYKIAMKLRQAELDREEREKEKINRINSLR